MSILQSIIHGLNLTGVAVLAVMATLAVLRAICGEGPAMRYIRRRR
ncbi:MULTISPECIES: hypothetical protein [unclassified Caulobacter]|jgi:hypothetical protein|nr:MULTISPECIES: hypothetical protein [unclassified Caulobacter]